jgi:hypothetical protein
MKRLIVLFILYKFSINILPGQSNNNLELFRTTLSDVKSIVDYDDGNLWGINLGGDILLLDIPNQQIYIANISDNEIIITQENWKESLKSANTVQYLDGKVYVSILLNSLLAGNKLERQRLLIHELFHLKQDSLKLPTLSSNNYHLDTPKGKSLMIIELEVLSKALASENNDEMLHFICEALSVRKYRQSLFPDNNENLFELNEGLAEYSGIKLVYSSLEFYNRISASISKTKADNQVGYANSFAYTTGPIYCYFLDRFSPQWKDNKKYLNEGIPLFFNDLCKYTTDVSTILRTYDYEKKLKEQSDIFDIDSIYIGLMDSLSEKLYIKNEGINITFNPLEPVIPINEIAVFIKTATLSGSWG